ncbi:UDP-N-acetylmuramoyl-tripeptide--D-alanyl-D-alanine ligase [Aliiroseovarius halocynthiae]|uniref:UDP-N-acetylmuramoyl-tripeptide--D-alanyl-D-alanine ligase n=1 Tax=Aliiroseovarius halocynthiae TaxID=985055 RepID=A0A545SV50_9RHOB|nr:UDP-N-acetylmuramoyl-tripeptide--D-alanyl-D-alanine ligase [Aliiroseovarius halocynthiae]TQV68843.1 UDP-N-acetylmuramoyl-tripeptide--D-alanyl-D-alanine ligase [Aliiroseovarius halocynthiae]SMR71273.1 UDP-N-acetylmuramoyl-tripeptide--D-alanyl-D-alanine ligase [Aliiroseovarius halocynthiae]
MSLWTANEAAKATGGEVRGDWAVSGVSIDTRTIEAGDLFVALKAARDGHEFVAQALEKGAGAALVSHVPDGVADGAPLLIVDDVLTALEDLGRAARARTKARVIAVTGSVGKTSTKEMLRTVLKRQGKTHAAEASYNNHWGVPLTLARMPADADFAVIEIGMSNPGEIEPLARMARPHVALVTTVAAAHLEAFDDLDGIAREKGSIFKGLAPEGIAIVNGDLDTSSTLKAAGEGFETQSFGATARGNDHHLIHVVLSPEATICKAKVAGQDYLLKIASVGRHFAMNALAVLVTTRALGGDVTLAARDISHWAPPSGRGTHEDILLDAPEGLTLTLIDDAFNANPTSMAASLEVLAVSQPVDGVGRILKGRRMAILGDMLELGPDEAKLHADIADLPFMDQIDIVHCSGPLMRSLWERLSGDQQGIYTETAAEMAAQVHTLIDAGDVVLVKGSKGSLISKAVDAIRKMSQAQG